MKYRVFIALILMYVAICIPPTLSRADSQAKLPTKRFAVTINVKSKKYGAKNRKDCTKAFQKAIWDASKKGRGAKQGRVIIPKGTYYLKGTLLIGSNVYIKCEPGTRIIKKSNKFAYMIRSQIGKGGGYRNIHNVLIEGGTWDADYRKYTSTVGGSNMCFVHGNNIVIRGATICNNYATHLIELVGVQNATIENCKMYGYKTYDSHVKKEAIQLDIAHSDKMNSKGYPYDDTPCKEITIFNNEIYDYARGIGTHSSVLGVYNSDILIQGNNIHHLSAEALYLYNFINTEIINNGMIDVGKGILIKSGGTNLYTRRPNKKETILPDSNYNIRIISNVISANAVGGSVDTIIGIHIVGEEDRKIAGVLIDSNQIFCGSSLSIYMKNVLNSIPIQNTVNQMIHIK